MTFLLYNENHAIVAWLKRGFADEEKAKKGKSQDVFMRRLPCAKGAPDEVG